MPTEVRIAVRKCSVCGLLPRYDEATVTKIHLDGQKTIDHKNCATSRVPIQEVEPQAQRRKRVGK